MCMYVYIYIYTHTYTYVHIYIYTYTYIYIYICGGPAVPAREPLHLHQREGRHDLGVHALPVPLAAAAGAALRV